MAEIINIQQLPDFIRLAVSRFVERLITIHQGNVISIAIYGSAASGNFIPKVSDVNVVVIVKKLDFAVLKATLKLVQEGRGRKINAPLFLTEDYIARSLDVFPIEFLNIKNHHVLVYGKDIFKDLSIDTAHMRIFCEQQVKGKLVRIRQAYLETGFNLRGKINLLYDSLNSLIPIFENLLRLRNQLVPSSKLEILRSIGKEFGVDDSAMIAVCQNRTGMQKMNTQTVDEYLDNLIQQLEKLALVIDA